MKKVTPKHFWAASIGYLMVSMLLSIIVSHQSSIAGVKLIDTYLDIQIGYVLLKLLFGVLYLRIIRLSWYETLGLIAFALLVRLFAESTFTIALIGAMMGRRVVTA